MTLLKVQVVTEPSAPPSVSKWCEIIAKLQPGQSVKITGGDRREQKKALAAAAAWGSRHNVKLSCRRIRIGYMWGYQIWRLE